MINHSTLDFLKNLTENNNKEWFHDHKKAYQNYKDNYLETADYLLQGLKKHDPKLEYLEAKKCIFRINRDIRFSLDKSPYKTNMGIWLSRDRKNPFASGYYFHLDLKESFLAGGVYCPDANALKMIRKEIAFYYEDLNVILSDKRYKATFNDFDRDVKNMLKTSPKGYESTHPAIDFLRLKSFTTTHHFKAEEALKPNFIDQAIDQLSLLKPLNEFLDRAYFED
jgi:uncharacterized protein (TIGR02453 family)